MIDRQRPWWDLHDAHRAMRAVPKELPAELRRVLSRLSEMGHCTADVPPRFSDTKIGSTVTWGVRGAPIALVGLPHLTDAQLTLLLKTTRRHEHLHQFTAAVEGRTAAGSPWIAAVDLDDDVKGAHMGVGACGHASFHCHVGQTRLHQPEVRVPFPAVGPLAAVDWLLTQVLPEWEPAPWRAMPQHPA